jgi:pimeloyl-ACP methyl ester carboxylesterase
MRARYPDIAGYVERDGVRLGYEVFGDGDPTILLLPTWTIIHSRSWKMQVAYLSRRYRVITYDPPGNGRSDRITDPDRHSPHSYAQDAVAVLDACGVDLAVLVGLSLGAQYGVMTATKWPDRVAGLAMIGPALPLTPPAPERAAILDSFHEPYPDEVTGWGRYNLAYWHDHYADFAEFFFKQCFSEPHSTKPIEDAVRWSLETTPEVLEAEASAPGPEVDWSAKLGAVRCPTLVIHGTADRIHPHERGVQAARLTNGTMLSMEGSGHIPNVRDPVKVNLALRDFVESVAR